MDIRAVTWFQLTDKINLSTEQLGVKLSSRKCRSCPSNELETMGWVSPFGDDSDVLVHSTNNYWLICAQKESRLLPAAVINDSVAEKINKIEQNENRIVGKKEKSTIKEEMLFTLLPKAFVKKTQTSIYYDPTNKLLAVCSSSKSQIDQSITLLRNTLGSLKITPLASKSELNNVMTDWLLTDSLCDDFSFGNDCEMLDLEKDNGGIKFSKQNLVEDSILRHLQEGKTISQLSLVWQNSLSFNLSKNFSLSRIKWLDLDIEDGPLDINLNKAQLIDASFVLMTKTLSIIIDSIIKSAGGRREDSIAKTYEVAE
jgi:recombination associated protein RdgC